MTGQGPVCHLALLFGTILKNLTPQNLLPVIEMLRWFLFYLEGGPENRAAQTLIVPWGKDENHLKF